MAGAGEDPDAAVGVAGEAGDVIVRSVAAGLGFLAGGSRFAAGFNGGGFSWGPIVGKVMTRLLTGQDPEFDLEPFRPSRFHDRAVTWANPFTAGEKSNPRVDGVLPAPI